MTTEKAPAPYRVVVGVDFTPTSDYAADEALRLAFNVENDELHLVHVIRERDARFGDALARDARLVEDAYLRLRQYALERGAALNARQWSQRVFYHVRLGDPAEALHQVAVDVDADLVIVGTHGRRGLERLILGSVAEALLKVARVPVLVARPKSFEGLARTPEIDPPKPGENVHAQRHDLVYSSELLTFEKRDSHIAGLL